MKGYGKIQVYTGDGKGKTSAALGVAFRACARGAKVVMLAFLKDDPEYSEAIGAHLAGFYAETGRARCLCKL